MYIPEQLADIRRQIDGIDDQIVPLLAKRIALALEASKHKHTVEEIRGCNRVQQVLDAAAVRAGTPMRSSRSTARSSTRSRRFSWVRRD